MNKNLLLACLLMSFSFVVISSSSGSNNAAPTTPQTRSFHTEYRINDLLTDRDKEILKAINRKNSKALRIAVNRSTDWRFYNKQDFTPLESAINRRAPGLLRILLSGFKITHEERKELRNYIQNQLTEIESAACSKKQIKERCLRKMLTLVNDTSLGDRYNDLVSSTPTGTDPHIKYRHGSSLTQIDQNVIKALYRKNGQTLAEALQESDDWHFRNRKGVDPFRSCISRTKFGNFKTLLDHYTVTPKEKSRLGLYILDTLNAFERNKDQYSKQYFAQRINSLKRMLNLVSDPATTGSNARPRKGSSLTVLDQNILTAISKRDNDALREAVNQSKDVNFRNKRGHGPFQSAVNRRAPGLLKTLLSGFTVTDTERLELKSYIQTKLTKVEGTSCSQRHKAKSGSYLTEMLAMVSDNSSSRLGTEIETNTTTGSSRRGKRVTPSGEKAGPKRKKNRIGPDSDSDSSSDDDDDDGNYSSDDELDSIQSFKTLTELEKAERRTSKAKEPSDLTDYIEI